MRPATIRGRGQEWLKLPVAAVEDRSMPEASSRPLHLGHGAPPAATSAHPATETWLRRRHRAVALLAAFLLVGTALVSTTRPTAATATTVAASGWHKGANLASWWYDEWEQSSSDASLSALRATGSTDAAFVVTWYMASRTSSMVAPDSLKTPTDAGLLRAMAKARALGMRVVLKPHVDVVDGSFRGDIAPDSPKKWFNSYTTMLNRYAALAQKAGAELLVVGTELSSMSRYEKDWRGMIAGARTRFSGQITFGANWIAGAGLVKFWDALDYIGIDAYMPLASSSTPNPTVDQLAAAWRDRGYVKEIGSLQARWAKPVLFTELGYQSRIGTAVTPWYTTGPVDREAQRRAYEATYQVWAGVSWFKGIYWWDWNPSYFDPADGNFNPRGKPAEATVTAWNAVIP
ncbi:MAG: glycoside hydrolase family 113 [Acidimicrobiales bacterium]